MRLLSCIALVLFLTGCQAASERDVQPDRKPRASLETFCETQPCRKNQQVRFRTESGEVNQLMALYWPVVQGQDISVLPGEELMLEINQENGHFAFKQVTVSEKPEITLRLSLKQMDDGLGMILSVYNPLDKVLKFHIQMIDFLGRPHKTSSCPILPGRSSYESWPHPIPELLLTSPVLLDNNADTACVY